GVTVSSQIIKTLEERGWIDQIGVKDVPGRPALFATTKQFLDDVGLRSIGDLPALETDEPPGAAVFDGQLELPAPAEAATASGSATGDTSPLDVAVPQDATIPPDAADSQDAARDSGGEDSGTDGAGAKETSSIEAKPAEQ